MFITVFFTFSAFKEEIKFSKKRWIYDILRRQPQGNIFQI